MLTVQELAKATGLHPNTIRHADRRGLVKAKRDINGYRHFSPEAVGILRKLYLLNEGDSQPPEAA